MAATSKTWPGSITDARIDADSPTDVTLWADVRDSLVNLSERIGDPATFDENIKDHNHSGVGSALLGLSSQLDGFSGTSGSDQVFDTSLSGINPLFALVIGFVVNDSGADNANSFVGFANGIGTGANGLVMDDKQLSTTVGYAIDPDAIGGRSSGTSANGLLNFADDDLDVTTFSSSNVIYTGRGPGAGTNTWRFKSFVFGQ